MKKKRWSVAGIALALLLSLLSPFGAYAEDNPEGLPENEVAFVFSEPENQELPALEQENLPLPIPPEEPPLEPLQEPAVPEIPQENKEQQNEQLPEELPELREEAIFPPEVQPEAYFPNVLLAAESTDHPEDSMEVWTVDWEFPQDAYLILEEPLLEPMVAELMAAELMARIADVLEENETPLMSRIFDMNVFSELVPDFQPFFGQKFMVRLRLEGDGFTPETLTDILLLKNDGTAERVEQIDVQPWFLLDEEHTHGVDVVFAASEFCPFAVLSVYAQPEVNLTENTAEPDPGMAENPANSEAVSETDEPDAGETDVEETEQKPDEDPEESSEIYADGNAFTGDFSTVEEDNEALIQEVLDLLKNLPPEQAAQIVAAFDLYELPGEEASSGNFETENPSQILPETALIPAEGLSFHSAEPSLSGGSKVIFAKKLAYDEIPVLGEIWAAGSAGTAEVLTENTVDTALEAKIRSFSVSKLLAMKSFLSAAAAQVPQGASQPGAGRIHLNAPEYAGNCSVTLESRHAGETEFRIADGTDPFDGSEELQLTVCYSGVDALRLKQAGYSMTYQADPILSVRAMNGSVVSGENIIGEILITESGLATLTFDPDWADSQIAHDAFENETEGRTFSGSFRMRAGFNLSVLSAEARQEHRIGNIPIRLEKAENVLAEYAPVSLKNEVAALRRDPDGHDYLDYRITAIAEEYGCPDGKVEVTFTENAKYAEYYMLATAEDSGSETAPVSLREASEEQPFGMTWNVGSMEPGEERTLTYSVRVSADFTGNKETPLLRNLAEFYSGSFLRNSEESEYCESAGVTLRKSASEVRRDDAGDYLFDYTITAEANEGNPYDLTDIYVTDSLENTEDVLLPYLFYEGIEIRLPDESQGYPSVYPTEESKAFEARIPLMKPGETAEIKYTVRAKNEIETAEAEELTVCSQAQAWDHSGENRAKGASYSSLENEISLTGEGSKEYGNVTVTLDFPYGVQPGNYVFALYRADGEEKMPAEQKEVSVDEDHLAFTFDRLEPGVAYCVYEMQPSDESAIIADHEIVEISGLQYRVSYTSCDNASAEFILPEDGLQAEVRITNELLTEIRAALEFKGAKPENAAAFRFGIWDHEPLAGEAPLQEQNLFYDPNKQGINSIAFSGLSFGGEYYIFELDDALSPIRHGTCADVNGISTAVEYSGEGRSISPAGRGEEPAMFLAENKMVGSIVLQTTFSNMRNPDDSFRVYFRISEVTKPGENENAEPVETPLQHEPVELSSAPYSHKWSNLELGKTYRVHEVWKDDSGEIVNAEDNDVILAAGNLSAQEAFRTTYNGGEGNSDIALTIANPKATLTVNNFMVSNFELPESGGSGTQMFYISGGIAILAAVLILLRRKTAEK